MSASWLHELLQSTNSAERAAVYSSAHPAAAAAQPPLVSTLRGESVFLSHSRNAHHTSRAEDYWLRIRRRDDGDRMRAWWKDRAARLEQAERDEQSQAPHGAFSGFASLLPDLLHSAFAQLATSDLLALRRVSAQWGRAARHPASWASASILWDGGLVSSARRRAATPDWNRLSVSTSSAPDYIRAQRVALVAAAQREANELPPVLPAGALRNAGPVRALIVRSGPGRFETILRYLAQPHYMHLHSLRMLDPLSFILDESARVSPKLSALHLPPLTDIDLADADNVVVLELLAFFPRLQRLAVRACHRPWRLLDGVHPLGAGARMIHSAQRHQLARTNPQPDGTLPHLRELLFPVEVLLPPPPVPAASNGGEVARFTLAALAPNLESLGLHTDGGKPVDPSLVAKALLAALHGLDNLRCLSLHGVRASEATWTPFWTGAFDLSPASSFLDRLEWISLPAVAVTVETLSVLLTRCTSLLALTLDDLLSRQAEVEDAQEAQQQPQQQALLRAKRQRTARQKLNELEQLLLTLTTGAEGEAVRQRLLWLDIGGGRFRDPEHAAAESNLARYCFAQFPALLAVRLAHRVALDAAANKQASDCHLRNGDPALESAVFLQHTHSPLSMLAALKRYASLPLCDTERAWQPRSFFCTRWT